MTDPQYYKFDAGGTPITTTHALPVTSVDASGNPSASAAAAPSTGTVTSVSSAATSTTLKAANASRKGLTITNTDANPLKVLLGAGAASAINFSVNIATNGYYELPYGYTGIVTGIWDVDGGGAAFVTEFT